MAEHRIKVSKGQLDLIRKAQEAQDTAARQLNLVLTTIVVGADLESANLKSIDAEALELVVEVPDITPAEEVAA